MRLAPGCRTSFDDKRKEELDRTLRDSSVAGKADLFLDRLGRQRGRKCGPTWPISKEVDLEVIGIHPSPIFHLNFIERVV